MRCDLRQPKERHAVLTTFLACESDSPSEAVGVLGDGFSTPVLRWALQARGRNWVEGRIAACPRLQHKRLLP